MVRYILLGLSLFICLAGCDMGAPSHSQANISEAQQIVDQAIDFAGGDLIEHSFIAFDFRNRHYTATRDGGLFTYERIFKDTLERKIRDELSNEGLTRYINGMAVDLSKKDSAAYSNSVNSVIYFALLPYFLNNPSVIKQYLGEEEINGQEYYKVKVTFRQQGGGKDFEDEFIFWFDKDDYAMDYLAYKYLTDGGGARLRKAYNVRRIEGIRFADFENYQAQEDTREIEGFVHLLREGKMELLSKIENEHVSVEVMH